MQHKPSQADDAGAVGVVCGGNVVGVIAGVKLHTEPALHDNVDITGVCVQNDPKGQL